MMLRRFFLLRRNDQFRKHFSDRIKVSKRLEEVEKYGLYDADSKTFRIPLDLSKAANILSESGLFWEAAKYDVLIQKLEHSDSFSSSEISIDTVTDEEVSNYIELISNAVNEYFPKKDLEDRVELVEQLDAIMSAKRGKFVLYIGG